MIDIMKFAAMLPEGVHWGDMLTPEIVRAVAEAAVKDAVESVKPEEFHGWYCAHCRNGVDASDVTFHEQHTVCGRMIANDVPPRPQVSQLNLDYLREMGRLEARIRELEQASAAVPEVPQGAIHNGRAFADRLESEYKFDCEAGPLHLCSDWQELRRCFEHLAEWALMLAASQPEEYLLKPDDGCRLVSYAEDGSTCTINLNGQEIYFDRNDHVTALAARQPEVKS